MARSIKIHRKAIQKEDSHPGGIGVAGIGSGRVNPLKNILLLNAHLDSLRFRAILVNCKRRVHQSAQRAGIWASLRYIKDRSMHFRKTCSILLAIGMITSVVHGSAGAQSKRELKLKAAFLFNIAKFVDWPAKVFRWDGAPFNLCIFGEDPFGSLIDDAFEGRSIKGRPIQIQRPGNLQSSKGCHLFFISTSEASEVSGMLDTLHSNNALTVSEINGFAGSGGIIGFYQEENNLKIEINQKMAEQAGLKVSSKLLRIGRLVN